MFSIKIDSENPKKSKTPSYLCPRSFSLKLIPLFSTPLFPYLQELQRGGEMRGLSSVHNIFLCFSFLLPLFPCTSVGPFHGLLSFRINLFQSGISMRSKKYHLFQCVLLPGLQGWHSSSLSSLTLVPQTFFLLTFHCSLLFLPFLNVFPDMPSAWLMG